MSVNVSMYVCIPVRLEVRQEVKPYQGKRFKVCTRWRFLLAGVSDTNNINAFLFHSLIAMNY